MLSFDKYFVADVLAVTSEREVDFSLNTRESQYTQKQVNFILSNFDFSIHDIFSVKQTHGSDIKGFC